MGLVTIDWSSARVEDAKLTVALDGELPSGWKQSFKTTVRLLGDHEWGKVRCKHGEIRVAVVVPDGEEKLRHFLESVVTQANAAVAPEEDHERDPQAGTDDGRDDSPDDDPDAQMTERFRAFATAATARVT
jgi:hypothetical protein